MVEGNRSLCLTGEVRERADRFLSTLLDISRNRLQKNISFENVLLNGKVLTKNSFNKFRKGDQLEIEIDPLEELSLEPQPIPLDIVFENEDIMLVNKQAGLVVHPAPGHPDGTMMNGIIHHLGRSEESGIRPGLVHRIDKDTSGLLVVAKSHAAFEALSKLFASHRIRREYVALIWGCPKERTGTITTPHGRDKRNRKRFSPEAVSNRIAVTHYEVIEEYRGISLVRASLETGRTHQIRMHMRHLGHPIVNDELYNGARKTDNGALNSVLARHPRQMLHARTLGFSLFGKELYFEQEIPDDMKEILDFFNKS